MKTNNKKTPKVSIKTTRGSKNNLTSAKPSGSTVNLKQRPARIFITGESPMVEQYAGWCSTHGYDVSLSWNERPEQKPDFKSSGISITNSIPAHTSIAMELTNTDPLAKKKNLERLDNALGKTVPILSSSITITATEQASWISEKHRLVGIAAFPTLDQKPLIEIAPTIYAPKETMEVAKVFFQSIGKEIEIVQDRIGMVLPRILCCIINEAVFAITEDIATPQDIDLALKLGVRFPHGPLEWAEHIGWRQVYAVLTALHTDLQEERYRISPLLKQMAITWK